MRTLFLLLVSSFVFSSCTLLDDMSGSLDQATGSSDNLGQTGSSATPEPVQQSAAPAVAAPSSAPASSSSRPIRYQAWWDGYRDPNGRYTGETLTRLTMRELNRLPESFYQIVPDDTSFWCPAFPRLSIEERKAFYLGFISGIARFETDFRADVKYLEPAGQYSRGLLQLGQLSLSYYPSSNCDVSGDPRQLHDLSENLACGAMLIRHWVTRDNRIASAGNSGEGDARYYGSARYWSTLRRGRRGHSEISAYTRGLPVCSR